MPGIADGRACRESSVREFSVISHQWSREYDHWRLESVRQAGLKTDD